MTRGVDRVDCALCHCIIGYVLAKYPTVAVCTECVRSGRYAREKDTIPTPWYEVVR